MKNSLCRSCLLLFALLLQLSLSVSAVAAAGGGDDAPDSSRANGTATGSVLLESGVAANDTASESHRQNGNYSVTVESVVTPSLRDHAVTDATAANVESSNESRESSAERDDRASDRDEDDGLAADVGRVAELYEDLEDSVVFEDSEADDHGGGTSGAAGGGRLLDEHHLLPAENGILVPVTAADDESSAPTSRQKYDAAAAEEDAVTAGNSPAVRSVKFPEYVRSSSYRKGWPGGAGNVTRPEELFRFWDPYEWTAATSKISAQCAEHVEQYQTALRNGKMWAYKSKSSPR